MILLSLENEPPSMTNDMKMKYLPLIAAMMYFCVILDASAQKKPLDHDVYDSWQSVSGVNMSDDGKVIVWNVNPQEGDGTLYVKDLRRAGLSTGSGTLSVPRGYQPAMDPDGKWVVCRIKPEFAKTRQERIDRKKKEDQTKDSLAVIDLSTMAVKKFPATESFSSGAFPLILEICISAQ